MTLQFIYFSKYCQWNVFFFYFERKIRHNKETSWSELSQNWTQNRTELKCIYQSMKTDQFFECFTSLLSNCVWNSRWNKQNLVNVNDKRLTLKAFLRPQMIEELHLRISCRPKTPFSNENSRKMKFSQYEFHLYWTTSFYMPFHGAPIQSRAFLGVSKILVGLCKPCKIFLSK